ncbi:MAG: hypothetical protein GTO45_29565 [Candidatus Aminicenantes bacterium]|nr:hypothetical protein [Candidatus Aminicenantes bacterium]NIM82942.1 hypothetical protein [Candidatus Aminicenantes bacterium]NIN22319.1 hypothetical protein [Candidatus Aminicenantes bacterium]NIN46087.1 hypothetical protein [Candidatus Aminicenantes bacterium]NIN88923.1 hypothetical protein [Candidatus Aminicenantes bacterium]
MSDIRGYDKLLALFDERKQELIEFSNNGTHIFSYHCLFVPKEVVTASGAAHVELPWLAKLYGCKEDQLEAAEKHIPHSSEEFCTLCRWNFMTGLADPHPKISQVIGITTCAPLIKVVTMLPRVDPEFPPLHVMNLPRRLDNEDDMENWFTEVKILMKLVEEVTEKKISNDDLEREIKRENRLRSLLREILEIRRTDPIPIKSSQASLVADLQFVLDSQKLIDSLEELNVELKQRKRNGINVYPSEAPRLLLTGPTLHDHPQMPGTVHEPFIIKLIEELGGAPVAEDFCAGIRSFWATIPYAEDPLRQIANHYANVINCACQTPNQRRIDQCISAALGANVDGVIYINLRTCKIFGAEVKKLQEVFEKLGIPFTSIERTGDPESEQVEQLKNRIEPFIQTLRVNNGRKKASTWQ